MADTRRTVLITGCSPGGIGHALALEFHKHNLRVFATARQTSQISDLAALGIETFSLDVTNNVSILSLSREITSATSGGSGSGKLDMLVNNAGRNYTVPALDVELAEVRATFETNLFAVMRLCQEFAPMLIASATQQEQNSSSSTPFFAPTILNIGSVAALMPYVFGSAYNASKAALHSYGDTLRVELSQFNVRVVTAVTGGVKSNIARTQRELRPDSLYAPLAKEYQERLVHSQTSGIPAEEYARGIVRDVLRGTGRKRESAAGLLGWVLRGWRKEVWGGGSAWVVWFMTAFAPKSVLEAFFIRAFKLWKLRGTVDERGRGKKGL